jgi:hydroxypyruvate isomerase
VAGRGLVHPAAAGERGPACLTERCDDFRRGLLEQALPFALALKCPRIHLMAGLAPRGAERAALRAVYVDNLAWAAREAASVGIDLLIEPINGATSRAICSTGRTTPTRSSRRSPHPSSRS